MWAIALCTSVSVSGMEGSSMTDCLCGAPAAANDMFGTLYDGRYNIFLMGIFATYAGFIYNEVFSVPMEAFGNTMWCSGEMSDAACWDTPGVNASTSMQKWLRSNIREAWDFTAGQTTGKEVRRAARAPVFSLCIAVCCCEDSR